jgi:uncharacterized membrane protein
MKTNEYSVIADKIIKLLDGKSKNDCKIILQSVNDELDKLCVLNANLSTTVQSP